MDFILRNNLSKLRRDARRIKRAFKLPVKKVIDYSGPEFGWCLPDNTIRIRLLSARRKPLHYNTLLDTLVHEMAHLRYRSHGQDFKRFKGEIKTWILSSGTSTFRGPTKKP